MSKFKNWNDVKKKLNIVFTEEEKAEMELEKSLIESTIDARENTEK